MSDVFARHGVRVVALSTDTADQARAHARRDSLQLIELLADPELRAISTLGMVLQRGLPFKTTTIAGIPLGYPVRPRRMAIPTSILVDAHGIVRWIDRADDYRLRGDRHRIETALAAAFGTGDSDDPRAMTEREL